MSFNLNRKFNSNQLRTSFSMKRPPQPVNSISFNLGKSKKPRLDNDPNSILNQRKSLPVYKLRKRLLQEAERHNTLIVIGETGSGKTTQIPQFLCEAKICGDSIIGVTQPRRMAAITVCYRVAKEMNVEIGSKVGFTVRFEDVSSEDTRIKYLTDGMLLREAMADPLLSNYGVIILDEAHERTVHTDVLFGVVKTAQHRRSIYPNMKPLKIIIMSATMDVDNFSNYFNKCPVVYLEGRQYSVKIYHAVEKQDDYNFACLNTVFKIHREAPLTHDMLVFLTGQEEIEAMALNIRSIIKDPSYSGPTAKVNPLYAAMSTNKQMEAFHPSSGYSRKIVLSTNIAETSVTLPGIKYVVDSGKVKSRHYHPATGIEVLKVVPISQAQAWQRAGRAGRDSDGFCYRAYTEKEFSSLDVMTQPEILRCNLSTVLLQLLALRINAFKFDFMNKPSDDVIEEGYKSLKKLGVIESLEELKLTSLGEKMARFPLDPKYSKILLSAQDYSCVDEVVTIIAILSSESLFINNPNRRQEAAAARTKFGSSSGDHVTLINIYRAYLTASTKQSWAFENFINLRNMEYAMKVRKQLLEVCRRLNVTISSCGSDYDRLRQCLVTGLFMNLALLQKDKKYLLAGNGQQVDIHPTSVLHGSFPPVVLFTELVQTSKCFIRYLTPIDPEWLPPHASALLVNKWSNE